tara:strand:+ start:2823 stop:3125 length:303 start_codon:yes stop_codon:yes gene_type:complete
MQNILEVAFLMETTSRRLKELYEKTPEIAAQPYAKEALIECLKICQYISIHKNGYIINLKDQTCSCPHFKYRKTQCKHLKKARLPSLPPIDFITKEIFKG